MCRCLSGRIPQPLVIIRNVIAISGGFPTLTSQISIMICLMAKKKPALISRVNKGFFFSISLTTFVIFSKARRTSQKSCKTLKQQMMGRMVQNTAIQICPLQNKYTTAMATNTR